VWRVIKTHLIGAQVNLKCVLWNLRTSSDFVFIYCRYKFIVAKLISGVENVSYYSLELYLFLSKLWDGSGHMDYYFFSSYVYNIELFFKYRFIGLNYTVKPIYNGIWIQRNPVFNGECLLFRGSGVKQYKPTWNKRKLSNAETESKNNILTENTLHVFTVFKFVKKCCTSAFRSSTISYTADPTPPLSVVYR
jgi:hypothetical protein